MRETCATFQPVEPAEISIALEVALASPALTLNGGLFDVGWDVVQPTVEILVNLQQQGRAFWWRERDGLLLLWELGTDEDRTLGISLPACKIELLSDLLLDVRRLAAQQGYTVVFWISPLKKNILSAAVAAGYKYHREHDNYVYEKRHPART